MDTGDITAAALIKWEPHLHCLCKYQNSTHLHMHKNTLFHFQFIILSLFYFTQHNNTVHVVFFCTEAFRELVTNTGYSIPMSVKSSQEFYVLFFFFFFLSILPFKKYQFHKRYVEVFVCCFVVSVRVCLHVKKHLYSSVGKKGYVWNLSLPLFVPIPRFAERGGVLDPGSVSCQRVC